jgi:hypothetical protein
MTSFGPFSPAFWEAVSKYGALTVVAVVVILGALWFAMKTLDRLIKDKTEQSNKATEERKTMTEKFLASLERVTSDYRTVTIDNTRILQALVDSINRREEGCLAHQRKQDETLSTAVSQHGVIAERMVSIDRRLEGIEKK